ncbi:NAD(P)-dependent oxidoreductase [Sporosarcina sp. FSL W7-1349]|uniref:NAD(P)-dependent oxidoreductase n=1 Tax=Sporosarcina sp. FSL W7-1349 TaxID=2921561 RepID=UPI0030F8C17E
MGIKVGVIGLGNMGGAIAEILSSQYEVVGLDIDESRREAMKAFEIETTDSLAELAKQAEVIFLSMPRASISKSIIEEISPMLAKGSTIIETSTVLPSEVTEFRSMCWAHGVRLIDAAILGGVGHMKNKQANLLVGDSDGVVNQIIDILQAVSAEVQVMGPIGAGMSAKIINNGVAHGVMSIIVEAAALGVKLGIQPEKVYELLSGETALLRPLTHRYHERIQNGEYEGGMSTRNARKDSMLFLKLAQENDIPLFSIQAAHSVYEIATGEGYGDLDYAAIAKLWENWSDINFAKS